MEMWGAINYKGNTLNWIPGSIEFISWSSFHIPMTEYKLEMFLGKLNNVGTSAMMI